MKELNVYFELISIIIGFIIGSLFMVVLVIALDLYKEGQVDCINGEIYYELIVHEDKTSSWEKIQ